MRFLVDEDVAVEVARCLRQAGHEVSLVAEVLGVRTDDVDIWHYAVRSEAIVVTCNRQDFLELAGTAPETGVVIRRGKPPALPGDSSSLTVPGNGSAIETKAARFPLTPALSSGAYHYAHLFHPA